jgi:hypothetical protein
VATTQAGTKLLDRKQEGIEMRSKRWLIAFVAVLALLLGSVGVAVAITNGEPDDGRHPYVGLLVFDVYVPDVGNVPAWRCSGALIAPKVVLTAGHCTDGAVAAHVWFNEKLQDDDGTYLVPDYPGGGVVAVEGTPYTNPKYRSPENPYGGGNGLPAFSYRDVGIVVLEEEVDVGGMADLPAAGLVDTLKNKTDVELVGYGVQHQAQIPGSELPHVPPPPYWRWTGLRQRFYAPSQFVSGKFVHAAEFMRLSMNPGGGKGGTCFGDSGGPDLLGGTDTVLAVNSYVTNVNCSGVGYSSRVDIPEVLDWIYGLMP